MSIIPTILFLATLVYRYDFTPGNPPGVTSDLASGYIEMKTASGEMDPLEAIYDFQATGVPREQIGVPYIPAITFTFADSTFNGSGPITWNEERIDFSGLWSFSSPALDLRQYIPKPAIGEAFAYTTISGMQIFTSWPYDGGDTQPRTLGLWKFAGTRNVPEAGGTLLYLALGTLALAWRKR